jgi:eukaryotic-like serine/threonine-protein kinase
MCIDGAKRRENDAPTSARAAEMTTPSTIGPYRIIAPLEGGGMGKVYRARHVGSDRVVAVKSVSVPHPRWLEAIRREIHALTQIRHPGIVRIVDHGVDHGLPWYAMDLLEGETLAQFSRRIWSRFQKAPAPIVAPTEQVSETEGEPLESSDSPLPIAWHLPAVRPPMDGRVPAAAGQLRTILRIMRRVCAALGFLHGEGFVNCDVKPDNIVLVEGTPVIIDFGLAARHPGPSGREALEALRGVAGTPHYMSPEQVRGELVDARSDLYALGCVLYELITGTPPFKGPPASVRSGHLYQTPTPPSEIVADVPPELERVILKLLDKDLTARFGYADEVATLLAGLSDDVNRLPDFPPPRSYLYRPRLVGRDALMKELVALRERAAEGSGSLVLLAGESGVGKTRIAVEVTRIMSGARMWPVTSELSSLSEGSSGASPLQAVRPLLRAIADRCQEGGPAVTERLLGERREVLVQYEPLLAQVPASGPMAAPLPLPVDAARRRLFRYLAETLAAFAQEQPVLWVVDDLAWADELSLSFLQSLTPDYLEETPTFVLCTYRSEDATDAVITLAKLGHVKHVTVSRLDKDAVTAMVGDMLATDHAKDGFVEFVGQQAEGNPFFVTEYLRGAVTERLLYRDSRQRWQIGDRRDGVAEDYARLPLPGSLRELIEQRLGRLSPGGQQAGLAAAVLGREADVDVLREVADLSDDAAMAAIDELVRRQVLESTEPVRVRFAHDKLREVAYGHAPADRLKQLHARAGEAMETRWAASPQATEYWAPIGHHFAAAKLAEPAAKYLKMAADHARATYANQDAIALYRSALSMTPDAPGRVSIREKLSDVLALTAQWPEVRDTLASALEDLSASDDLPRSRFLSKMAHAWESEHMHRQALEAYEKAETALGDEPTRRPGALTEDAETTWWSQWIQLQIERVWVHYWIGDAVAMAQCVDRVRSSVEKRGTASQRGRFYQAIVHENMRRDRWVISSETLAFARAALDAMTETGEHVSIAYAQFVLAAASTFAHALAEAQCLMSTALAGATRTGDRVLQARCLTFFTLMHRFAGDAQQTAAYAQQALQLATELGMADYVGAAHGNLGWVAWRNGEMPEAVGQTQAALHQWDKLEKRYSYPVQWVARLHGIALALDRGAMAEARTHATVMLDPRQHRLPESVCVALEAAAAGPDEGDREKHLRVALRCAAKAGYC